MSKNINTPIMLKTQSGTVLSLDKMKEIYQKDIGGQWLKMVDGILYLYSIKTDNTPEFELYVKHILNKLVTSSNKNERKIYEKYRILDVYVTRCSGRIVKRPQRYGQTYCEKPDWVV